MIKEIHYAGYSTEPSDYECGDGQLATSINLISEDNQLKPVFQPAEKFQLATGKDVVFLHKTPNFTHYIVHEKTNNKLQWFDENVITGASQTPVPSATIETALDDIHTFSTATIYKVDAIGNTLLALASDGMHYMLWQNTDYTYLGTHLPELDLQFSLAGSSTLTSDASEVDLGASTTNPTAIIENASLMAQLRQAIMASANQVTAKSSEAYKFCFPFFVRYAYKLYDSTLTMQSAPIMMVPTLTPPAINMGWTETTGANPTIQGPAEVTASLSAYSLYHRAVSSTQVDELSKWRDIIYSVDIFISRQFYTYDQAIKDEDIRPLSNQQIPTKDIKEELKENSLFYLAHSITIDNIFVGSWSAIGEPTSSNTQGTRPRTSSSDGKVDIDFKLSNDNIVVRETLPDDYDSHDVLIPKVSYGYNSRLNIAQITKKLFNGYSPRSLFFKVGDTATSNNVKYKVVVEENGRNIVLESATIDGVYFDSSDRVMWFFYPNTKAKRVFVSVGSAVQELELLPHSTLNGAFYFGIEQTVTTGATMPSTSTDQTVNIDSKIYTSEVDNPFYFPLLGINTVGTGKILGISSAAKALSQGQFGQFPLYAFTDEGVWALELSSTGSFSARQPITRDVCSNPDSITQIDSAVLFVTDRGIMIISGSEAQCISDNIFAEHPFDVRDLPGLEQLHTKLGHGADACLPVKSFLGFLRDCQMVYDYVHQHIIVFNPTTTTSNGVTTDNYTYAYVYSLKSKQWGMMYSNLDYNVNSYPDALAVTKANKLVSFSSTNETTSKGLFVTRPLKLEAPDIYKTINSLIQRGHFERNDVGTVLYGSRDLYTWRLVWSSKDHYLRGFSGTPYKYFRIAGLTTLTDGKSLFGASVEFKQRLTNNLR